MSRSQKVIWSLKHPWVSLKIQANRLKTSLSKKEGTLFYVGMNQGDSFDTIFRRYERCYGFEANPDNFEKLKKRYAHCENVTLVHAAVSNRDGTITFNISNDTNAGSSSLGTFNPEWKSDGKASFDMIRSVTVPSVNLINFCQKHNISTITDYISDIQGMDYTVLKTLTPMLKKGAIRSITCEVTKDGKDIYPDLPSNHFSDFQQLLETHYDLVARGNSPLKEGVFDDVPESWWEMDCMWRVKN